MAEPAHDTDLTTVKLWDVSVRLIHWGMALLIPAMWWTAEEGELEWHRRLGLTLMALILFRLVWGFIGSDPARFVHFVRGPRAIGDYLVGRTPAPLGHNPLGALSVVAMLALIAAQLSLGLIAQDEYGLVSGPLNHLVSAETGEWATEIHELLFDAIVAVAALHIASVLYYELIRRSNLIGPMLTGRKAVPAGTAVPRRAGVGAVIAALAIAAVVTGWLANGAPPLGS